MEGQIIALGGGGFSEGSEPELDIYVLEQSTLARPKIGFIGTASGDANAYLVKFYARFTALNCLPSHLPLFRSAPDLEKWVEAQDVIYVGGGNSKSMLAVWKAWALPELLIKAMKNGTVVAGVSAGAICWFEYGLTDSSAGALRPLRGLGLLSGSCCPHYLKEAGRKPAYEYLVSTGAMPNGIAIDDGAAIHFRDGAPYRIIVGKAGANAYLVRKTSSGVSSRPIPKLERLACGE